MQVSAVPTPDPNLHVGFAGEVTGTIAVATVLFAIVAVRTI